VTEAPDRRRLLGLLATGVGLTAAGGAVAATPEPAPVPAPDRPSLRLCPEILGKNLRVVRPGQAMTHDYRQDRLTIGLDESDRIRSIQVG
jgi:hypothetical protein